jgi:hypothetical protein
MGKDTKPTVGQLIDQMVDFDEKIGALNKQAKDLKELKDDIELKLIAALEEQGVESSRGARATATISKSIVASVKDWDQVYNFVHKHKMAYLFEKRITSTVFRELLASRKGKAIPGIEPFERKVISLRSN